MKLINVSKTMYDDKEMQFLVPGYFKPYVRMTQSGKFVKASARQYMASKNAIGWELKARMTENGWEMLPAKTRVAVQITIFRQDSLEKRDVDNSVKAIMDACNGVVWEDDKQVDCIIATRQAGKDGFGLVVKPILSGFIVGHWRVTFNE